MRALLIITPIMLMLIWVPPVAAVGDDKPLPVPHHLTGISLTTYYMDYNEPDMSIYGFMAGVGLRHTIHDPSLIMLQGDAEITFGELDYDGETWGGTPVTTITDDFIGEFRILAGYDLATQWDYLLTPFAGIGYRYWNNDIEGPGGYEREVGYLYSPLGLAYEGPMSDALTLRIMAEYDLFWNGTVKSHLSDVNPAFNDPRVHQDTGSGYGARIAFQVTDRSSYAAPVAIELYLRYWNVDASDETTLTVPGNIPAQVFVYEPENDTTSIGISIVGQF